MRENVKHLTENELPKSKYSKKIISIYQKYFGRIRTKI